MNLSLEEAIARCEMSTIENHGGWLYALKRGETKYAERCKKGMDESRQLAEWLKELQEKRKADNEIPFGDSYSFTELDSIINAYEVHGGYYKEVVELLKELRERRKQSEIIHCKYCRWNDGVCYCEFHYRDVKPTDYCSWAERRTNDSV